jgi:hypothetical protein
MLSNRVCVVRRAGKSIDYKRTTFFETLCIGTELSKRNMLDKRRSNTIYCDAQICLTSFSLGVGVATHLASNIVGLNGISIVLNSDA